MDPNLGPAAQQSVAVLSVQDPGVHVTVRASDAHVERTALELAKEVGD